MSDLAIPEPGDTTPALVQQQAHMQTQAVARLGEWAHAATAAYQVAERLVQTPFVPEAFRNKPYDATAAILAGTEVGLSPMSALRSFDVIQGTAAPRAITLRAIVQSQGHEVWVKESTATRAIVCGRRRGSNVVETSTWTLERAKGLGLTGKHNWKAQPQAMLVARATSELCRLIAADAILGIGYTVEEIGDGAAPGVEAEQPPQVEGDKPATRKMSRKKKAEPQPEPAPAPDEPHPSEEQHDEVGSPKAMSPAMRKMFALLHESGLDERPAALEYVSKVVRRKVETRNDLSEGEVSQVIEALAYDLEHKEEGQ